MRTSSCEGNVDMGVEIPEEDVFETGTGVSSWKQ